MKVYKCLIQIYYAPQSYISATGEPRGFIIEYWNIIKKKLKEKGITFKEEITYSRNYGELINQVIKKNYDILIAPYWVSIERLKKVNFTYPIFFNKPRIVYNDKREKDIDLRLYLLQVLKIWIKPILFFIIFSILISLFLTFYPPYKKNNDGIIVNIYYTFVSFMGQPIGLIFKTKNTQSIITRIILLILIFVVLLYVKTIIYSESVLFIQQSNKLENNLKNAKIVTDSPASSRIVKNLRAVPVNVQGNDIFKEYLVRENQTDGMFTGDKYIEKEIEKGYHLKFSNLDMGILFCSFPINKKNNDLKKEIDIIIVELRNNGTVNKLCNEYFAEKKTVLC